MHSRTPRAAVLGKRHRLRGWAGTYRVLSQAALLTSHAPEDRNELLPTQLLDNQPPYLPRDSSQYLHLTSEVPLLAGYINRNATPTRTRVGCAARGFPFARSTGGRRPSLSNPRPFAVSCRRDVRRLRPPITRPQRARQLPTQIPSLEGRPTSFTAW